MDEEGDRKARDLTLPDQLILSSMIRSWVTSSAIVVEESRGIGTEEGREVLAGSIVGGLIR